ncbi:MAG: hypothetical protein J6584_09665, partial [Lactobacillus sp.]|nr:hypothetical protein [Lactobacillus sp.]
GIRTAFEYGGTTSGHTTNEFVPVGLVSVGLNKHCEINNVTYTSMNNMQPGGVANVHGTSIVAKYYEEDDAHCNLVTRHTVGYACFLQPQNDQSDGNYHNNNGMMRKDQFVDQFLINTAIGKPIVEYNYKFKHAPLSVPFYNPTNLQREYMYRGGPVTRAFTLKPILNSSNKTVS